MKNARIKYFSCCVGQVGLIIMINNKYFAAFRIPIMTLKFLGMWPERTSSRTFGIVYGLILHIIVIEVTSFCSIVKLIELFLSGSIVKFAFLLSFALSTYAAIFKTFWYVLKLTKIQEMLETLNDLLDQNSFRRVAIRTRLEDEVKEIIKVSKVLFGSAFVAITLAALTSCINHNERRIQYEFWYYFDYKENALVFWVLVAYQYGAACYCAALIYSIDLIPITFMSLISAALDELSAEIKSIAPSSEPGVAPEREFSRRNCLENLERCINQHIAIKNFAKEISEHLSAICFIQAFTSSVIWCTAAFVMTKVKVANKLNKI